jgi:hypothetical protein
LGGIEKYRAIYKALAASYWTSTTARNIETSSMLDIVRAKQIEMKENNSANAIGDKPLSILEKSTTPT